MKIGMTIDHAGDPVAAADQIVELEAAGLDVAWVQEAWGFDAVSLVGYLAARTHHVTLGTAILNVFTRTPALLAMTAAGCDQLSGGRFILGLGASGPQVIEGFHGVPYDRPLARTREITEICRKIWSREEPVAYAGKAVTIPLPPERGTGLGKALRMINHPVRPRIPIYWASLQDRSVEETAALADGWIPFPFMPEAADGVFGPSLAKGLARRRPDLGPLEVVVEATLAFTEDSEQEELLDRGRKQLALYVGGMGARGKNFYNEFMCRAGYPDDAHKVQDLYLDKRIADAEAAVPREWLQGTSLIGSPDQVAERVEAYISAGVTVLNVKPLQNDGPAAISILRRIIDQF